MTKSMLVDKFKNPYESLEMSVMKCTFAFNKIIVSYDIIALSNKKQL